jgi:hypothetical protein
MRALALLSLVACGCFGTSFDPPSYVTGLRVLAIKADPPEIPPGHTATITPLVVDTAGDAFTINWAACLESPVAGQTINPDCIKNETASYVQPLGSGASVRVEMPMVSPFSLGLPDSSNGLYLPLRAEVTTAAEEVTATYRLRYALGMPPNRNPTLSGVFRIPPGYDGGVNPDGGADSDEPEPLDDTNPLVVHAGDTVTLRATFTDDSAETYTVYDGDPATPARSTTEILSISWFATAGTFNEDTTGGSQTDTVLTLDKHLPTSGSAIDLWVVGRDERGGTDWVHHLLQFE